MMTRLPILLIAIQIHQAINAPQNYRDPTLQNIKGPPIHLPVVIANHDNQKLTSILVPLIPTQQINLIDHKIANPRKKKGPSIPIALPITHQLLLPTNLHVIPVHTNIHHTIHHPGIIRNENVNLHTIHATNVTHQSLIPILIPIHHTHLVPIHDLSVIPLRQNLHNVEKKLSNYKAAMEKRDSGNEEPINKFRSLYGGYGTGLFFGGHGAGHGFYAYGYN